MMSAMDELRPEVKKWLAEILGMPLKANRHIHSHQDEVYRIETLSEGYYLKVSKTLTSERDNLKKIEAILNVPKVIDFYSARKTDCLLISELPGRNLVELVGKWSKLDIVHKFAEALRLLHSVDIAELLPGHAHQSGVLLHGDMSLPNVIITNQGRIGYIDFGQMSFGSPDVDLADALWSLQRNIGPGYGELFLKEYGHTPMTPRLKAALEFRYRPKD